MKRKNISRILIVFGVLLIVSAISLLLFRSAFISNNILKAENVVTALNELMPEITDITYDGRKNNDMASIQIDGTDYIGILEVPDFQLKLPICSKGNQPDAKSLPYRYSGSIYDGSLILGGEDYKGQFEFLKAVDERNVITITDLDGNRYTYKVYSVERVSDCNAKRLESNEDDLTLFCKNTFGMNWIIVRCKMM